MSADRSARGGARLLALVLRFGLGALFAVTGTLKARDLSAFERALGDFGLVADALVPATALLLVVLEILGGLGLLFAVRGALLLVSALLALFLAVILYGLWLGLDVDCGCFGPLGPRASLREALWRNLVLLGACAVLFASGKGRVRAEP